MSFDIDGLQRRYFHEYMSIAPSDDIKKKLMSLDSPIAEHIIELEIDFIRFFAKHLSDMDLEIISQNDVDLAFTTWVFGCENAMNDESRFSQSIYNPKFNDQNYLH